MHHQIQISEDQISAFTKSGLWPNRLITEYLDENLVTIPDQPAITECRNGARQPTQRSYLELGLMVRRIALGLAALGIGPGDVVAAQLPNWHHFTALYLACVRIGAVFNPLMPIFRQRELAYMLSFGEAKTIIVPKSYRGFDYPGMIAELRGKTSTLKDVFVIEGEGEESFDAYFVDRAWEKEFDTDNLFAERKPGPNDITLLMYTSGTTGEPKGVMHTNNTLISNIVKYVERVDLGPEDVVLMASPIAHLTGFLYGVMMPIMLGGRAVLMDVWNPDKAVHIISDEGVTFTMASTPFLSDLTNSPAVEECDLNSLHTFLTAGAPIPRVLVQRASERLGVLVISCWGMTENGGVTTTQRDDPPDKVFETDGKPLDGMEVRVVGNDGLQAPTGEEGSLEVRGMGSFAGYLKKPELYGTDDQGWFETGDLARMDADGYIRITGRSKDVIIRGGENIPVAEVEELLYHHPAIQDVAIVAMPDERLGERGCAFTTLKAGQCLTFVDMIAHLEDQKLTRNYLPERLEVIDQMPRTPSGKIQKFRLREMARSLSATTE